MDWSNEAYVRLYIRETADDLELSWEALALWRAMLIKFDRSGIIQVRSGWVSVARLVRMPIEVVEHAGVELVNDGRVQMTSTGFLAPNFIAAQTSNKSDRLRQQESRDRRREVALQVTDNAKSRHERSQAVTQRHEPSQSVTLCLASAEPLLCSAEPLLILPPDKPAASKPSARKRTLPSNWEPERSEANLEAERVAQQRGVSIQAEALKFRDWAKGSNAKKADWDATWRNWTRNARPSGPSQQRASTGRLEPLTAADYAADEGTPL